MQSEIIAYLTENGFKAEPFPYIRGPFAIPVENSTAVAVGLPETITRRFFGLVKKREEARMIAVIWPIQEEGQKMHTLEVDGFEAGWMSTYGLQFIIQLGTKFMAQVDLKLTNRPMFSTPMD